MRSSKVNIVAVEALSYSGTTWLNLVLGSHPRALTLGPPDRVWNLRNKAFEGANLVWGDRDTFWKGFDAYWDRKENFLVALAGYAGVSHIIFDGPSAQFEREVMSHPDLNIIRPLYLRDARAITASRARKIPNESYLESILPSGWFYSSYQNLQLSSANGPKQIHYYEDCVADPLKFLESIGPEIGLDYTADALRFWEHDHHITTGNAGTIALLKFAKDLPVGNFESRDFYRAQLDKMKSDYLRGFVDERWKAQLSRLDRFYFDMILGAKHADLGYERDPFEREEIYTLLEEHKALVAQSKSVDIPPHITDRYLQELGGAKRSYASRISGLASVTGARAAHGLKLLRTKDGRAALSTKMKGNLSSFRGKLISGKQNVTEKTNLLNVFDKHPRFLVPADGTHYFNEILPSMRECFLPYRSKLSRKTLEQVCQLVHWNVYHGHGPDYSEASPYRITADTPSRYADLLESVLAIDGTRFLAARDLVKTRPNSDDIICHVRHDVDIDIASALQQAEIESSLGISTTYYILHTSPYYGNWNGRALERNEATSEIYCKIQDLGHEIALHTDGLGLYQFQQTDGAEGLQTELAWLRSQGLKISGSVTHNSFPVYGAENFAIFKDFPIRIGDDTDAHAVAHNGNLALLQQIDAADVGLQYEGNDFFAQKHTPIQYYALRGMNDWRHTTYNKHLLPSKKKVKTTESYWFSQEESIDHLARSPKGIYAFFIVHPVYYGLRANDASPSVMHQEKPAPCATTALGWRGYKAGAVSLRQTPTSSTSSYQSIVKINSEGFADVPSSYIQSLARRFVFLSKDQLATDRISVECKAHHAFVRSLRRVHGTEVGATSLAGMMTPLSARICWFQQAQPQADFTDIVLSVGLSDLATESLKHLAAIWGLEQQAVDILLPNHFDAIAPTVLKELKVDRQKPDSVQCVGVVDGILRAARKENGLLSLLAPVSRRIENAVKTLKASGRPVVLMLEDCGEPLGLDWLNLPKDQRETLAHETSRWLEALGEGCEAAYINPYNEMISYEGLAQTHWPSVGLWSIHGHTLAANALLRNLRSELTSQLPRA